MKVIDIYAKKLRRTGERVRGRWVSLPAPIPEFSLLEVKDHGRAVFEAISTPIQVDRFLGAAESAGLSVPDLEWLTAVLKEGARVGYRGPRSVQVSWQDLFWNVP